MWLTRLALRNPILILMMSLMTIVLGTVSLRRLAVDLLPEVTIPVVRVATFYTGAGPSDIERTITQPIERAVSSAPGVDRVESVSRQGTSVVSAWFNYGTNLDNAQFEIQQRVAQMLNQLPPGIQQPLISKFDITNFPVVGVALSSEELGEKQLYDLAANVIEPQLTRLPGVASAGVSGGRVRQFQINVQRDALLARGIGILDVVDAVRRTNLLLPSGTLRAGDKDYNVFANTQVEDVHLLKDVIVRAGVTAPGSGQFATQPVRVSDVAKVVDGTADQSELVRINGSRGVFLRVLKQPFANTIAVVDAVKDALPRLRGVPANIKAAIAFDQSLYIRAALKSLQHEALWGGLLAVLVILIFLASLRATGIVAIAIPLSVIATFVLLYFTGQTLNVFTLGGLALGIGRLVDDSIVELENIHRHLEVEPDRQSAVLAAAQEVAMPILASTITTIVVFFPVLFLDGVARNLFVPLALTIAFSLGMSFFVSRTVTPLLCLKFLPSGAAAKSEGRRARWAHAVLGALDRMDAAYGRLLTWVLHRRVVTLTFILGVFAASLLLSRKIGTEFFPQADEAQFSINVKTPIGTRLEKTEQVTTRIENAIRRTLGPTQFAPDDDGHAIIRSVVTNAGAAGGRGAAGSPNTGPHAGNLQINLLPRTERPISDVAAVEKMRAVLQTELPGMLVTFSTGGIVRRIMNMGAPAPIEIEILGQDVEGGSEYATRLLAELRVAAGPGGRPVLTDLLMSRETNYPQIDVVVDREKAGILGLSQQQIAQTILTSLVGNSQFAPIPFTDRTTGNEYFINVRLDDAFRDEVADLSQIFLRSPANAMIPLDTVASVKRGSGPVTINRKYLQRMVTISANVAPGEDLNVASAVSRQVIEKLPPPDGFTVRLGGQTEAQEKTFGDLSFAALMAMALVYMVLASQFKSLIDPLVIMFSVPLGITGVFLMLYLTGTTLSVNSYMGVIMMVGIVVSNGVLLVDFANVLRDRGKPLLEATIEAGRTRLRPILMTSIATVVGLVPMALGLGEGSESNLPLARAVIGGLTVSTVFTLFLVPVLYTLLARFGPARDQLTSRPEAGP